VKTVLAMVMVVLLVLSGAAFAQFNKCGRGFCPGGIGGPGVTTPGGSIPFVANFRVTNTGDQRVTSAGDSRVISP